MRTGLEKQLINALVKVTSFVSYIISLMFTAQCAAMLLSPLLESRKQRDSTC